MPTKRKKLKPMSEATKQRLAESTRLHNHLNILQNTLNSLMIASRCLEPLAKDKITDLRFLQQRVENTIFDVRLAIKKLRGEIHHVSASKTWPGILKPDIPLKDPLELAKERDNER